MNVLRLTLCALIAGTVVGCGESPTTADPDLGLGVAADAGRDGGSPRDGGSVRDAGPEDGGRDAGPANRPPRIVRFEANPPEGLAPLTVEFSWSVVDDDGDPLTCALDPDSEGEAPAVEVGCAGTSTASWTYERPGPGQALLRVEDPSGATDEATLDIEPQRPFALPIYVDGGYALAGSPVPDLDALEAACGVTVTATSGDDVTDRLRTALADAATRGGAVGGCVVRLPPGTFTVTAGLRLGAGVVLRGAGAARTTLSARLPNPGAVLAARGGAARHSYEGEAIDGVKGDDQLTVTATLARQAQTLLDDGHTVYGEVAIDNDPAKFPEEWARNYAAFGIGQVFEVREVSGVELVLDRPLNEPYRRAGLVRRLELRTEVEVVERPGVADLRLVRQDAHHAGTVAFDRTAGAFLLRVRIEKTGWAHLHVDRSLSCVVRQSHFEDAHDFGDGGQGYGVNLRHHTTGCLVEDNSFRRLRHAMILQLGSNGNVIAYNYAEDSRDNLGWLKADISLHGHYTHMNLIEGNVVEKIHVSDWWGPAPYHVVFRNEVSRGGIYVDDRSDDCAVIDNRSDANFPLESPLRVDRSVQFILCIHNTSPDGAPLSAGHRDCDDENDPAQVGERPRPPSLYRALPLLTPDGRLPARVRFESGSPVPPPP